jgi:hypothetical protein
MAGVEQRVGALEEYINRRVEDRLQAELIAVLAYLEERLTRVEFIKVARILAEAAPDEAGQERSD